MKSTFLVLASLWLLTPSVLAAAAAGTYDAAKDFPPGSGSKFLFTMKDAPAVNLVVSIADASGDKVSIEYFFSTDNPIAPVEMWQQYVLRGAGQGGKLKLTEGYVLAKELKTPEKVTSEYLVGFDGVLVNDFLFASKAELAKTKVGDETITVPAGSIQAAHYRQERNGQRTDFWISDEAKPIGLVKLVSSGKKPDHNYEVTLQAIVKNLQKKIDPTKAKPLSEKGKSLLATPNAKDRK